MATPTYLAILDSGKPVYLVANIMQRAWSLFRRDQRVIEKMRARGLDAGEPDPFGYFLKQAWSEARARICDLRMISEYQTQTPEQQRVADLEGRTRLGVTGWKELDEARAAVAA